MMTKISASVALVFLLVVGIFGQVEVSAAPGLAAGSSQITKASVDNFMKMGTWFVQQAGTMSASKRSPRVDQVVISLYKTGGKLFQTAAKEYRILSTQKKAKQADVDKALNGMRFCVGSMEKYLGQSIKKK